MFKSQTRGSDLKIDIPVICLIFNYFREIIIKGDQKIKVFILMKEEFCFTSSYIVNKSHNTNVVSSTPDTSLCTKRHNTNVVSSTTNTRQCMKLNKKF